MGDDERKAWGLLIQARINPSQWFYTGTATTSGIISHGFKSKMSGLEISLAEPVEGEKKKVQRSYFWHAPSLRSSTSEYGRLNTRR